MSDTCGVGGQLNLDLSLANFSAMVLEHLMLKAGTTKLQAGELMGKATIKVGDQLFTGTTIENVMDRFLYWLLLKPYQFSSVELEKSAKEQEAHVRVEMEQLLDELTREGMSEYGKRVTEYRVGRGLELSRKVATFVAAGGSVENLAVLQKYMVDSGEKDLTLEELVVVLQDYTTMMGLAN